MFFMTIQTTEYRTDMGSRLESLLKRIGAGQKEALAALYEETKSAVYGFALSLTKNVADAEDILQDTYLKIWTNGNRYQAKGTPMAWILTITKNLALMKLRSRKKEHLMEAEEWDMEVCIPDGAGSIEDRHLLEAALTILTEEERQIILLHAVSGLKFKEIGTLLELKLPTVLSKYHRGLKKLRVYMEGVDADDRS